MTSLNTRSKSRPALLLLLLAPALVACDSAGKRPQSKQRTAAVVPVEVERLRPTLHQQEMTAVATVEPWRRVTLRAETAGRVTSLKKEVGQRVKRGALLASQDGRLARRALDTTRVRIKQANVSLTKTASDLRRARKLQANGTFTQAQLEQAQAAHDGARAALELARAQSSQSRQQLSLYTLRAPFSGVISRRSAEVGDYATPGAAVYTLVDDSRLKLVVGLAPAAAATLKVGHQATVSVATAAGARRLPARVHLVRPVVDSATRRLEVELSLENKDSRLRPGLSARVSIPVGRPRPLMLVSSGAVVEQAGSHHVYVSRQGRAVRLPVTLGVVTADRVEIRPRGSLALRAGEQLVVSGMQRLAPGARLEVVRTVASAAAARDSEED